jgi:hypothetical protein
LTAQQDLQGADGQTQEREENNRDMKDRHGKGARGSATEYGAFAKRGGLQFVKIRRTKAVAFGALKMFG